MSAITLKSFREPRRCNLPGGIAEERADCVRRNGWQNSKLRRTRERLSNGLCPPHVNRIVCHEQKNRNLETRRNIAGANSVEDKRLDGAWIRACGAQDTSSRGTGGRDGDRKI